MKYRLSDFSIINILKKFLWKMLVNLKGLGVTFDTNTGCLNPGFVRYFRLRNVWCAQTRRHPLSSCLVDICVHVMVSFLMTKLNPW